MSVDLFEAYCRNELSSADRQRLLDLVRDDPEQRRAFTQHLLFRCAMIKSLHQEQNLEAESQASGPFPKARRRRSQRPRSASRPRSRRLAVSLLVLIAAGIAGWVVFDASIAAAVDGAPVAWANGSGAILSRSEGERPLDGEQRIEPGDRLSTSGDTRITLRYADGSTLVLQDGQMVVDDWRRGKTLRLEHGQVRGEVTTQTQGPMRLIAELTEATVLGTAFTFTATQGWSGLKVESGQVQFTRHSDGSALLVGAGQMARHAPGLPWRVHAAGTVLDCTLDAQQARIDAGSQWRLIADPKASSGYALEDGDYQSEQAFFKQAELPPAARFTLFAQADVDYTLWISGSVLPSDQTPFWTDAVFVLCPEADWSRHDWRTAEGWDWIAAITRWPPAIYNSFATRYGVGRYGWVAGPADPDDVGVPERLRLRFPRTGTYELQLHPISGPLRIDRLVLRRADKPAPDAD